MSGEKKQRYQLTIEGRLATFWDNGERISHSKVEQRLNALTEENERLEAEVEVAYESGNQACIAQHEVQERLDARIAALTRRVEELEAALRYACTVDGRVAFRTENGVPMQMPPDVQTKVQDALAQRSERDDQRSEPAPCRDHGPDELCSACADENSIEHEPAGGEG